MLPLWGSCRGATEGATRSMPSCPLQPSGPPPPKGEDLRDQANASPSGEAFCVSAYGRARRRLQVAISAAPSRPSRLHGGEAGGVGGRIGIGGHPDQTRFSPSRTGKERGKVLADGSVTHQARTWAPARSRSGRVWRSKSAFRFRFKRLDRDRDQRALKPRDIDVRARSQQQHVVAVDHRRVGGLAMSGPGWAVIEPGQGLAALVHIAKTAQPHKAVGIVEVAKQADQGDPVRLPGSR
jgi:hypothetical protein